MPSALAGWAAAAIAMVFGATWALGICCGAIGIGVTAAARARMVHGHWFIGPAVTSLVAAAAVCAGLAGAGAARIDVVDSSPLRAVAVSGGYVTLTGSVTDDPRLLPASFAPTVIVSITLSHAIIKGGDVDLGGRVVVFGPESEWSTATPGQQLTFRARLDLPDRRDLTVAVANATGSPTIDEGPPWYLSWAGVVRARLAQASRNALPPDAGGLLPAIVVGDTSAVPAGIVDSFTAAGLTHLTAVSGANFTFLIGAVFIAAKLATAGPRTTTALCALVLVAFVVIARPSPSVLRAAVMGVIGLMAFLTGRRKQAMPSLCAAVIVLLAIDPALAVGFGFALSVSATAALVVLAPVITTVLERYLPEKVAAAVGVACAAVVVTAPIVAAMSGTFSVVAVAANVLAAPVVGPITVVGALVAVVAPVNIGAAELIARAAGPPLRWLIVVAERMSSLPYAVVSVPTGWSGAGVVGLGAIAVVTLMVRRSVTVGRGTIDR